MTPAKSQTGVDVPSPTAPPRDLHREKLAIAFVVSAAGGAIKIAAKDGADQHTAEALRRYIAKLGTALPKGEAEALLPIAAVDDEAVARIKVSGVAFALIQEPAAVRIDLLASSQASRTAIHDFIRAAAAGSAAAVQGEKASNHPGNNLGWDAPRDPDVSK